MEYDNYLSIITKSFEKNFKDSYKSTNIKGKSRVIKYFMSFYRRWYFSAIVEDTILSPANLITSLNKQYHKNASISTFPYINSYNRLGTINFRSVECSLKEHYVVSDLKLLLDSCIPDFYFDDRNKLESEHEKYLLDNLTICDPYYIEYLILVSSSLNLIKRIPSIHSHKVQVTSNYEEFFSNENEEIFKKIVLATIDIVIKGINELIPSNGAINRDYILSILIEPITTDDIFKYIYSSIGLNIEKLMDYQGEGDELLFDEIYNSMISSTFYLGILIDRVFFTPFGFYLRLINPGYLLPYDNLKEISYAVDAMNETEDISVAMFSPCSHFSLTELGLEFFKVNKNENYPEINYDESLFEKILAILQEDKNKNLIINDDLLGYFISDKLYRNSKKIYELKIKLKNNKAFWKKIEFLEETTLKDLYLEICYEFNLDIKMDYSFFQNHDENPFSEYTSSFRKKGHKNTEKVTLGDFIIDEKHKFVLALYNIISPFMDESSSIPSKYIKFDIEVQKIKEKDSSLIYPRVKSEGSIFQDFDMDWIF